MHPDEINLRITILHLARVELADEGIEVRPLTQHEISRISGVGRGTVWHTEHSALAKLRRQLEALEQPLDIAKKELGK